MRPLLSLSIAALIAAPAAAPANSLIAAARESGLLDTETALLYELYEALEPESLPPEYRDGNPGPRGCATPLVLDALQARDGGSPGYGRALAKALARPALSHQVVSPSGRFRIHFDVEGEHAVDPADADGNGIPDYVDVTAAVIDSMWHLEIEVLGYDPPPTDGVRGGGDEHDIYIEQISGGYYGWTQPEESGPRGHSYLRIDNNFTEPIFGRPSSCDGARGARELTALRVTLAHEFFHMIQFGYYQGSEGFWWQESSATWMEEVAYPEADDYLQYLCDFVRSPERSLESPNPGGRRIYGSAIFSHFLDQRYGRQVVREIWEEHRRRESASLDNFHRALQRFGDREPGESGLGDFGLGEAVNEFATWNYFTGERHREGFYEEGHKYPAVEVRPREVGSETLEDSGRVDHLASAYLALEPLDKGGVTISTGLEGLRWRRRLALVSPDSVEVRVLDIGRPAEVVDWHFYSAVVLVVSNTAFAGIDFPYTVSAQFGADLTGGRLPPEVVLGHWFPNPFLPGGEHSRTRIRYRLDGPGSGKLSIFAGDGRPVRRLDLDKRLAREYEVVWDGRNDAGKPVGSGLYYYVLDAGGEKRQGTLAVVRE